MGPALIRSVTDVVELPNKGRTHHLRKAGRSSAFRIILQFISCDFDTGITKISVRIEEKSNVILKLT